MKTCHKLIVSFYSFLFTLFPACENSVIPTLLKNSFGFLVEGETDKHRFLPEAAFFQASSQIGLLGLGEICKNAGTS